MLCLTASYMSDRRQRNASSCRRGEKTLGTFVSAANGLITVDMDGYAEHIAKYRDCLKKDLTGVNIPAYLR